MKRIELLSTLPKVFAQKGKDGSINSQVWCKNLTFERGVCYLIQADSGVGKSSLCNFIYGSRTDYQGVINFDAEDITQLSGKKWRELRNNSLSILFQDLRLFSELTALENVELKNRLTNFKSRNQIVDLFEELSIGDKLNTKLAHLSLGQQQRVSFIRALCQPFDFMLLDEPISHLDPTNSAKLGAILHRETTARGAGAIITSIGHHLDIPYDKILKL